MTSIPASLLHLSEFQIALLMQVKQHSNLRPSQLPWKNRPKDMKKFAYMNLGTLRGKQLVEKFGFTWYLTNFGKEVLAANLTKRESPYCIHEQIIPSWKAHIISWLLGVKVEPIFLIKKGQVNGN